MMRLKVWIVLMALCLLLSACGNTIVSSQQEISASEDSVSSAAVQPGELIETYVPEYAKGFSIEYYEGGAKIIDTHIEATASTAAAAQRILLLPTGATEPLNAQWDGKIEGEVTSVVTLASSHAGHFANLDAVDVVKGCSIKPESCYVNSLKTALENGSAVYVGTSSSLDQELIASLAPQVIFVGGMSSDVEVAQKLDGQVIFFATPAEEYGEIEFKNQLIADGKIAYGGGKCELIRIGAFDDVDVALAHHISLEVIRLGSNSGNGFVSKVIRIKGKAAHAAGCPEKGVNALSAASLGLQALALNRETFRDEDCVRVHPILTKGGDLVNVVPNEAVLETLVRGKTLEAFADASVKTDRSFKAGALAMGAGYRIETMPGYLPSLWQSAPEEMADAVKALAGEKTVYEVRPEEHSGGSTDVGDVQHLLPVITFNTGGAVGGLHQVDFDIVDEEEAYVLTAKIFALSAYRMLKDGAEVTKRTKQEYHPRFADKQEYIAFMDSFNKVEEADIE